MSAPTIADIKDILDPTWRENTLERWGFEDSGHIPSYCSVRECASPRRNGAFCSYHYYQAREVAHG